MTKFKGSVKGIEIKSIVTAPQKRLKKNEYYALMVTDTYNIGKRPNSDYVDLAKGHLGLERTTNDMIYISKDFFKRKNPYRGDVVLVEVADDANFYKL